MDSFGKRLKELRLKSGYSQKAVTDFLNSQEITISQSMLSRIENGEREPNIPVQVALADFFNVSIDYLCGKEDKTIRLVDPLDSKKDCEGLSGLNDKENALLSDYRSLNENGKDLAETQIKNLVKIPALKKKKEIRIGAEFAPDILIAASGSENFGSEEMEALQQDIEMLKKLGEGKQDD